MYGAIVTALYRREKAGKGAHVGSSLLANGLWIILTVVQTEARWQRFAEVVGGGQLAADPRFAT